MTPKEKASKLRYYIAEALNLNTKDEKVLKCSIIAVNEIISFNPKGLLYTINVHRFKTLQEIDMDFSESDDIVVEKMTALEYWEEVKNEINNIII